MQSDEDKIKEGSSVIDSLQNVYYIDSEDDHIALSTDEDLRDALVYNNTK